MEKAYSLLELCDLYAIYWPLHVFLHQMGISFFTLPESKRPWIDSDKELIELINCQLTVSGVKIPHLALIFEYVRWGFLLSFISSFESRMIYGASFSLLSIYPAAKAGHTKK